jgi:hypothetical protein
LSSKKLVHNARAALVQDFVDFRGKKIIHGVRAARARGFDGTTTGSDHEWQGPEFCSAQLNSMYSHLRHSVIQIWLNVY